MIYFCKIKRGAYYSHYLFHKMGACFVRKYLRLLVIVGVLYYALLYAFNERNNPHYQAENGTTPGFLPPWASMEIISALNQNYVSNSNGNVACRLPNLQPFHPSILNLAWRKPAPLVCETKRFPLLFNSSQDPTPRLIPVKTKREMNKLGVESCCFRLLRRRITLSDYPIFYDNVVSFSKKCKPLSLETATMVPSGWEFVAISCKFECGSFCILRRLYGQPTDWNMVDFHSFVHAKKASVTTKPSENSDPDKNEEASSQSLSVMMLGLDSVSRMSFLRVFPEIYLFMKHNLAMVEMEGYHKIGENTFPNIAPLLVGMKTEDGVANDVPTMNCKSNRDDTLDNCPFIWKEYKAAGYRTLFAEDGHGMAIFNMNYDGFRKPPTDYYFRPMALAAGKHIGHENRFLSTMCYGPRPAFQLMLNYVERMAIEMHSTNTPFFQFAMSGSLTHELLNGGRLMYNELLESLQRMNRQGVFNQTVLIFIADHGSRLHFIRSLYQGYVEDRLPVFLIAFPPWFKTKYPAAFNNLQRNRKRLITVFDIHRTLRDILNIDIIQDEVIKERQKDLDTSSYAISLFLPVPISRTCASVGISNYFCTCNLNMVPVSIRNAVVVAGANNAVEHINKMIKKRGSPCAYLYLDSILHAELMRVTSGNSTTSHIQTKMYRIVFQTKPGLAHFETTVNVMSTRDKKRGLDFISGTGSTGRINMYRDQSQCVKHDEDIMPFCYCEP